MNEKDKILRNKFQNPIERILFKEEHLKELKNKVVSLEKGNITANELKKLIIDQRKNILMEILEIVPFILQHENILTQLDTFLGSESSASSELFTKIQNQQQLLEFCEEKFEVINTRLAETLNRLKIPPDFEEH